MFHFFVLSSATKLHLTNDAVVMGIAHEKPSLMMGGFRKFCTRRQGFCSAIAARNEVIINEAFAAACTH